MAGLWLKGEVRIINDRNVRDRRCCMNNNGKSPTLKFFPGEERRPSEVQRVSRSRRLPVSGYVSGSHSKGLSFSHLQQLIDAQELLNRLAIDRDVRSRPGQDWHEPHDQ